MMICFLLKTRKGLLDHLVKMHDQFIMDMLRKSKHIHENKQRTAPAHVIVQRLTNSFPSEWLSKAFTNLGRIIKTEYILRYITDKPLRRTVQLQLNKGEYRHKLPRWVFFANQGEFTATHLSREGFRLSRSW